MTYLSSMIVRLVISNFGNFLTRYFLSQNKIVYLRTDKSILVLQLAKTNYIWKRK